MKQRKRMRLLSWLLSMAMIMTSMSWPGRAYAAPNETPLEVIEETPAAKVYYVYGIPSSNGAYLAEMVSESPNAPEGWSLEVKYVTDGYYEMGEEDRRVTFFINNAYIVTNGIVSAQNIGNSCRLSGECVVDCSSGVYAFNDPEVFPEYGGEISAEALKNFYYSSQHYPYGLYGVHYDYEVDGEYEAKGTWGVRNLEVLAGSTLSTTYVTAYYSEEDPEHRIPIYMNVSGTMTLDAGSTFILGEGGFFSGTEGAELKILGLEEAVTVSGLSIWYEDDEAENGYRECVDFTCDKNITCEWLNDRWVVTCESESVEELDPATVYCIYAADGEEGLTGYELLSENGEAPAGKELVAKYVENGEYELMEEDYDLIILANDALILGETEMGLYDSDYIGEHFRLYESWLITDEVSAHDEHFDSFSYPEGELTLDVLKDYYGDAEEPAKRYDKPFYDYIVYGDWEVSAVLRARTLWIQEGAKLKTVGYECTDPTVGTTKAYGSTVNVKYALSIDGTMELAGGDARTGEDTCMYLQAGCELYVGSDGALIGGSGENERGVFWIQNRGRNSIVEGITLYKQVQGNQYEPYEVAEGEDDSFYWVANAQGGIWVLTDHWVDTAAVYSIYGCYYEETDSFGELEMSASSEAPEGKELIGKYIKGGSYTMSEEDRGIRLLVNSADVNASGIDSYEHLWEIPEHFRIAGESQVAFEGDGLIVGVDIGQFPYYDGEDTLEGVLEFFTSETYEGRKVEDEGGEHHFERPIPYSYTFFDDYTLTEDFDADGLMINGSFVTGSHEVREGDDGEQVAQGGCCINATWVSITGAMHLGNGDADEDKPTILTIRDDGALYLEDEGGFRAFKGVQTGGILTGDDGAILEFEGNAVLEGITLYEERDGEYVPFELTGMRESFSMRDGKWVRNGGEPGPDLHDGEFTIDYNEFARGDEEPKATVVVDDTVMRKGERREFSVGREITFRLNPGAERAGCSPIVEIIVANGSFYSTREGAGKPIVLENNTFTFTPEYEFGFNVRVYWSEFDYMDTPDEEHFLVQTKPIECYMLLSEFTDVGMNEPNGGLCYKRIYPTSILDNDGVLTITIIPKEGTYLNKICIGEGDTWEEYIRENPGRDQKLIDDEDSPFTIVDGNYVYTISRYPKFGNLYFEAECNYPPFFNDMEDNTFLFRRRGREDAGITVTSAEDAEYAFEEKYEFETGDTIAFKVNGDVYAVIAAPSNRQAFEMEPDEGGIYSYDTEGGAGVEFQVYFTKDYYYFDQCHPNFQEDEFEVNYQVWNDGENAGGEVTVGTAPVRSAYCDTWWKLIYGPKVTSVTLTVAPNEGSTYLFTVDGEDVTEAVKANNNQYVWDVSDHENIPRVEVRFQEVIPPIVITRQPVDYEGPVGSQITFSVEAQGEGLTYLWQNYENQHWGTVQEVDATQPTIAFTFYGKQHYHGMKYRCVIRDQDGNEAITNVVQVIVVPTLLQITQQPEDWFGEYGQKASFTVVAEGDGLRFRWQYKKGTTDWVDYNITTYDTANFRVSFNEKNEKYAIRCFITDEYGNSVTTNEVRLKKKQQVPDPAPLAITTQPVDWVGEYGKKASFTVTAEGEGLTYAWQYKKSGVWNNYGVTTWDTPNFKVSMNEKNVKWPIRCLITDKDGNSVTTNEVWMKLKEETPAENPITITKQPESFTGRIGQKASFTVAAVHADQKELTYQWQYKKDGKWNNYTVTSATTATLKITLNEKNVLYPIRCLVKDADGNQAITSEVGIIVEVPEPIVITKQPVDWTGEYGKKASFNVTAQASDGGTLTYQWQYKKGTTWTNYEITTADTPNFKVTMNEKNVKWAFRCLITDEAGNYVTTDEVYMKVREVAADPIVITSEPADWYGTYGKKASFNVTAVSTTGATLTYQWQYKKGTAWADYAIATADTPNFRVTMNEKNVKWAFRCVITDSNGQSITTNEVWMRLQ